MWEPVTGGKREYSCSCGSQSQGGREPICERAHGRPPSGRPPPSPKQKLAVSLAGCRFVALIRVLADASGRREGRTSGSPAQTKLPSVHVWRTATHTPSGTVRQSNGETIERPIYQLNYEQCGGRRGRQDWSRVCGLRTVLWGVESTLAVIGTGGPVT
eukprot:1192305-Prorocentrum_minimum.AAC.8